MAGLGLAAVFAGLGRVAGMNTATRISAATLFSVWAAICGLLGVLLTGLWAFTDHRFAHMNENLLVFHPLWLVLIVALPLSLRGPDTRAAVVTRTLLTINVALGAIALVLHAVGLSRQDNLGVLGLGVLPAAALLYVARRAVSAADSSAAGAIGDTTAAIATAT
jgi:hypothetical protein